ncbi:hypothetical protein EDD86DRAFT_110066 [Gorgonomyces haynaldii]|nr:hypothetical protein EDD86DRAFT_110066 [Gorgonomyces haynaldii]
MLTNTILIPNVTIHWYKILDPTPQMVSHWLEQYPVSWNPTIVFSFEPLKLEASQSGVLKDIGNLLLLSQTEPMIQHLMDAMHNYYDKRLSRLGYRRLGYYFFNQKHCIRLNLQFVHHSLTLQPKQVEFPFRPLDRFNLNQHLYLAPFGVPVRLVWDKEAILNQHPFPQKLRVGFDCHVVDVDSSALFVFEHKHLDIPEAQFTKNDLDMFSQFYQVMENSMEQPVMIPQQLSQPVEKPSPAERTTSSQSITTQHRFLVSV